MEEVTLTLKVMVHDRAALTAFAKEMSGEDFDGITDEGRDLGEVVYEALVANGPKAPLDFGIEIVFSTKTSNVIIELDQKVRLTCDWPNEPRKLFAAGSEGVVVNVSDRTVAVRLTNALSGIVKGYSYKPAMEDTIYVLKEHLEVIPA